MTAIHGESSWQPEPPPPKLAGKASEKQWRAYMLRQGYLDDEIGLLLEGLPGDTTQPGLQRHVLDGLALREVDDRGVPAVQGLVVGYLELRPPVAVLDLPTAPPRYLSPDQFGLRLELTDERSDRGTIYTDRLTGRRWEVIAYTKQQAGHVVAAAALYGVVGVTAPAARLVTIAGVRHVAHHELVAWVKVGKGVDPTEDLHADRPADEWLRNLRIPIGVRVRKHRIAGFNPVVRADLTGCAGYSSKGRLDAAWGPKVADLTRLPNADELVPMLRRVTSVSEGTITDACRIADLPGEQADQLCGTLIARRAALARQLDRLT